MQRENDTALLARILESTREGVGEVLLAEEKETERNKKSLCWESEKLYKIDSLWLCCIGIIYFDLYLPEISLSLFVYYAWEL